METTVIISLITALAAIIAPVITAAINNKNALRLKQIEAKQDKMKSINLHEREVLEKALSGMGVLMSWRDGEATQEACKNILTAGAYVDQTIGEKIINIISMAVDPDNPTDYQLCKEVCEAFKNAILNRIEE